MSKWIMLTSEKKEPPANVALAVWVIRDDIEYWAKAMLKRIEFAGPVKIYVFEDLRNEEEITTASHYMLIEKPKE